MISPRFTRVIMISNVLHYNDRPDGDESSSSRHSHGGGYYVPRGQQADSREI